MRGEERKTLQSNQCDGCSENIFKKHPTIFLAAKAQWELKIRISMYLRRSFTVSAFLCVCSVSRCFSDIMLFIFLRKPLCFTTMGQIDHLPRCTSISKTTFHNFSDFLHTAYTHTRYFIIRKCTELTFFTILRIFVGRIIKPNNFRELSTTLAKTFFPIRRLEKMLKYSFSFKCVCKSSSIIRPAIHQARRTVYLKDTYN